MNPHPSAYAALLELTDEGAPGVRVREYVDGERRRQDVPACDILWCLRQSDVLVAVVDEAEAIRADVGEAGEALYPVIDDAAERVFSRRAAATLVAGSPVEIVHVGESAFDDAPDLDGTPGLHGGESA